MAALELASGNEPAKVWPSGQDLSWLLNAAGIVAICALAIFVVRFAIALIQGTRLYVLAQLKCCQPNFVERYGKWALVTGAAHGIGLAFAKELARRGMSLLLVDIADLDEAKSLIEAIPNVGQVETLHIDLADSSLSNFDKMSQYLELEKRDIGIVINNAGIYPGATQKFAQFPMSYHLKLANLNMLHPVHVTRMIIPGMIKRGRGMVINISSIASVTTLPYMGIYNPSKIFVASLTRQLQVEYSSEPIDIVLLTTGPVLLYDIEDSFARMIAVRADDYARSALNAAAVGCKEYCGTLRHGLMAHLILLMNCVGLLSILMRLIHRTNPQGLSVPPLDPKKVSRYDYDYYQQRT